ncbi:MAG: hypothetical protein PHX34_00820 [Candidatus Shapirobacteria bacterium]|nr:hypothetical protein [Candidatus Shapirobacteria bacterium]
MKEKSPIDWEVIGRYESIKEETTDLIENNDLIYLLDIIGNQRESDYLLVSMAWNISRKKTKYINYGGELVDVDYFHNSSWMDCERKKGFLNQRFIKWVDKEIELKKRTTDKLLMMKNIAGYFLEDSVTNVIDRVTNMLSLIYIQKLDEAKRTNKEIQTSEIFTGSEDLITKFGKEIKELKKSNDGGDEINLKKVIEYSRNKGIVYNPRFNL